MASNGIQFWNQIGEIGLPQPYLSHWRSKTDWNIATLMGALTAVMI